MGWTDRDAQAKAGQILRVQRLDGDAAAVALLRELTPEQRAHVQQVTAEELARRAALGNGG